MNIFHEAKQVLDKDGKVNPLGPYGKSKLTGQEVASYFRKNRISDPQVKKAVEVALDLGGAYDVARKEIKKFFGDKILKSKEVQQALRFANEEVVNEAKFSVTYRHKATGSKLASRNLSDMGAQSLYRQLKSQGHKEVQIHKEEVVTEGKLGDSIIRRDFPNVWAASAKDRNILKKFHAKVDTKNYKQQKDLYRKDIKGFIDSLNEGTMALGIFDSNPSDRKKAIAGMKKLIKSTKPSVKVGSPEGKKFFKQLDLKYLSDDELADDFARSSNKNMTVKDLLQKHGKRLGIQFEEVEEAVSPAQQAAIAIAKKEKEKKESVMDSYRQMYEAKEFKQSDIDTVEKLTDRNEHTKSLMHIAKVMGDRKAIKKLELIDKMHKEYGHMPMNLKSLRDEVYDDLKKEMKKYSNGDDMYGAT